jgi:hypothetical protein
MSGALTADALQPNSSSPPPLTDAQSDPLSGGSWNGATFSPLAGSSADPRIWHLRFAPLLRLGSSGWTRPLWQDAGLTSSDLLNPLKFQKEVMVWTLCDTQKQIERQIMENRRQSPLAEQSQTLNFYGPLTWIGAWESANKEMLDAMTDEDVGEAMLFFTEEFYPRTDYWRNRVGFDHMPDLWAGLEIEWANAQLQPTVARMQQGPDVYEAEISWKEGADLSQLIRFQWCRHLWAWEKGLTASATPTFNFGGPPVATSSTSDSLL